MAQLTLLGPADVTALTGMGMGYMGLGQPARAVAPLERALAIRERTGAGAAALSRSRFLAARARWDSGRNRAKALEMMRKSRIECDEGDETCRKYVEEVDAWLAERKR